MLWNLTSDEVVKHWDLIKWGAAQVNNPANPEQYFVGLLKEILSGKAQVWFLANGERTIKTMGITKIVQNIAGINELLVDTLYGYSPMTPMEQKEGFEILVKFAKNMKVSAVIAYTTNPQVTELAKKGGFSKVSDVIKMKIEGDK